MIRIDLKLNFRPNQFWIGFYNCDLSDPSLMPRGPADDMDAGAGAGPASPFGWWFPVTKTVSWN